MGRAVLPPKDASSRTALVPRGRRLNAGQGRLALPPPVTERQAASESVMGSGKLAKGGQGQSHGIQHAPAGK